MENRLNTHTASPCRIIGEKRYGSEVIQMQVCSNSVNKL